MIVYCYSKPVYLTLFLIFVSSCFSILPVSAQNQVEKDPVDSLHDQRVNVTGYLSIKMNSFGNYTKVNNVQSQLGLSSGISLINSLRGQVPSISMPSYFANANYSGTRAGPLPFVTDALIVIDGVPYNNNIGSYMNLNGFDYASIAVISNTNALNFLGGANSGAFILNSKSGEGQDKPLFEFNSNTTYGWKDFYGPTGTTQVNEWYLTNSLAYSKDFGKVDTRISYTMQKKSGQDLVEPFIHYLKINTGFVASNRFNLRLIVDGRYSSQNEIVTSLGGVQFNSSERMSFLSSNLTGEYKLNNWISLTSQLSTAAYRREASAVGQNFANAFDGTNSFDQANLILNGSRQLGKIRLSGFTGYQLYVQNYKIIISNSSSTEWKDYYPGLIGQACFNYNDRINLSGHFKSGTHRDAADNPSPTNAGSVSLSLIFGDWLGMSFLNLGKIRSSFGAHDVVSNSSYPALGAETFLLPFGRSSPYVVNNFEIGMDLGFLRSRFLTTFNYFQNQENYQLKTALGENSRYQTSGVEADLRFRVLKTEQLLFETSLMVSRSTYIYNTYNYLGLEKESDPFTRLAWLNDLRLKAFRIRLLLESLNDYTYLTANSGFITSSYSVLREFSVSIDLPNTSIFGLNTKAVTLSIIGRNLAKFGESGPDPDLASALGNYSKSASLNVNVKF